MEYGTPQFLLKSTVLALYENLVSCLNVRTAPCLEASHELNSTAPNLAKLIFMGPILEYICSQTSFEARETRTLEKL